MEEFKTAQQVEALFANYGFQTQNGQYFVGFDMYDKKELTKFRPSDFISPVVAGINTTETVIAHHEQFQYSGLLVAFSDRGIACLQLGTKGLMKSTTKVDKLFLDPTMPMIMLDYAGISGISIKNYSFAVTKTKTVVISTTGGLKYNLMVNTTEKQLAYHEAGFAAFMEKFGEKKKK